MTDTADKRADTTRQEILRAAAHQFALRPYHQVGLDDVLAEAELTKGAMYFHFRSKHALALAVIDDQATKYMAAAQELLTRKLSGLETLVDVAYLIAVADISEDIARAGLNLLESVGRIEGLQAELLGQWIQLLGLITERAIADGDTIEQHNAHDVGRLLVSLYMGMRQTSNLDKPEQFLLDLEKCFVLLLPGLVPPNRVDYFRQFIRRRTALAIKSTSATPGSH
jgi:TetR/AcrR family transcriptional regulator, transcriptional repressor for nem operon